MKFFAILSVLSVASYAQVVPPQSPPVWDALRQLRGGRDLTVEQIQDIIANAVAGRDYPVNAYVPNVNINCNSFRQPGYYVDDSQPSNCQVFYRCDLNNDVTSYLCPNMTLFNQITLVCDWFYNVDCGASRNFYDYSNSRLLIENARLLDDQLDYIGQVSGAAVVQPAVRPVFRPAAQPNRRPSLDNRVVFGQPQPIVFQQVQAPAPAINFQQVQSPAPAAPVIAQPAPAPVAAPAFNVLPAAKPVAPAPAAPSPAAPAPEATTPAPKMKARFTGGI